MGGRRTIRYAIHLEEKYVVSQVDGRFAVPVGSPSGSLFHLLARHIVPTPAEHPLSIESVDFFHDEWHDDLFWTRFVPTKIKNRHRRFWGLPPLSLSPRPKNLIELCREHRNRFVFLHEDGNVGITHKVWGSSLVVYFWFILEEGAGYILSDLISNYDDNYGEVLQRCSHHKILNKRWKNAMAAQETE
jgi:hypothetical protein